MLANLMGLGECTEYDANSVCIKFDAGVTDTPPPEGTGLEVIAEAIAAQKAGAKVPLKVCSWYTKPVIGATDLECQFPSNAVLLLGAAGIGVLIFLSVRLIMSMLLHPAPGSGLGVFMPA